MGGDCYLKYGLTIKECELLRVGNSVFYIFWDLVYPI